MEPGPQLVKIESNNTLNGSDNLNLSSTNSLNTSLTKTKCNILNISQELEEIIKAEKFNLL